jgi:hypothetical protein
MLFTLGILAAMFADLGMGLDDLGAVFAFDPVVMPKDLDDGQIGFLANFGMAERMAPDRVDALKVVKFPKQLTGPVSAWQMGVFIGQQTYDWFQIFIGYAGVQFGPSIFFLLMADVGGVKVVRVDNAAGKGIFTADHHRPAFVLIGEQHVTT